MRYVLLRIRSFFSFLIIFMFVNALKVMMLCGRIQIKKNVFIDIYNCNYTMPLLNKMYDCTKNFKLVAQELFITILKQDVSWLPSFQIPQRFTVDELG